MESQLNIFNKGLNSDLAPMYQPNDKWTFPTLNARVYNNGKGFSITNIPGNTNQDNIGTMEGAELQVNEGYTVVGATEAGGVAFIFSVNGRTNRMEIGCFPSPNQGGGFKREYSPLLNIKDGNNSACNFPSNIFGWTTDTRMTTVIKIEYDNTVNMYICTGKDMLRIVNNGFDIKTGIYLSHRKYDRVSFEEATRLLKTPSLDILNTVIGHSNIRIKKSGGNIPYGNWIFFFRFVKDTYDKTLWLFETPPINIGVDTYEPTEDDDNDKKFAQGDMYAPDKFSQQSIVITIPVSSAYKKVEVGYSFRASDESDGFNIINKKGILTDNFVIGSDMSTLEVNITNISDNVMDFDEQENLRTIEMIPRDIHAVNNVLYQANMSNEVLDVNLLREFFKRVKVRCVVKDGELPMPTDEGGISIGKSLEGNKIPFRVAGNITIDGTSYNYHNEDKIEIKLRGDDNGSVDFSLNEGSVAINLTFEFTSVEASMETNYDIKLVFDETIYADLEGYEFHTTNDMDKWLVKDTNNSSNYNYEEISSFNKEYNSDEGINYVAGDYVTVIHSTRVHIKYNHNGAGIDGDYIMIRAVFNAGTAYEMISNVLYDSMHQFVCYIDYDSRMVYLTSPFNHTFTSDSISEMDFNDAYYSKQQHIIEDVGYFGGEIYAFSLMAVDIYGNKYGAFPCTGIDHYYANKESDLDYEAYEPCGGPIAEPGLRFRDLKADSPSPYTVVPGTRMFKKNQYGIYRFPSRSNYVKKLDSKDNLIKYDGIKTVSDYSKNGYVDDAFNLTQRLKAEGDNDNFTNVIRIFKVCFDFSEAYNWLTQYDVQSQEYDDTATIINLRNKLSKIVFLRAERTGMANNLIAQGIIQKPNTIIPFPKRYEYESLDFRPDGGVTYSHRSFEKLISYNFETIEHMCSYDKDAKQNIGRKLHLHGQLGNSSIKIFDSNSYSGDANDKGDVTFPAKLYNIKSYVQLGANNSIRMFNAKSFIYSGKYSHHAVDFRWDSYFYSEYNENSSCLDRADRTHTMRGKSHKLFEAPPALGAVSFGAFINNNAVHHYAYSCSDFIWGEMGSQPRGTDGPGWRFINSYPQQNIFVDKLNKGSTPCLDMRWYDYDNKSDISSATFSSGRGQYAQYLQYPLAETGGSIKVPFFKGYMPCIQRIGRTSNASSFRFAQARSYTTRCMYHPYDKTRAFFSPDFIYGRAEINVEAVKYIKPIRKTIYSGLQGLADYNSLTPNTDISKSYFKADGWKTFFAYPAITDFYQKPILRDYLNFDYYPLYEDNDDWWGGGFVYSYRKFLKVLGVDAADAFYLPTSIPNAGVSLKQNPAFLLHSVRSYFRVENPRECCPIMDAKKLEGLAAGKCCAPNHIDYTSSGGQSEGADIDANMHNLQRYISYATDFAQVKNPNFLLNGSDGDAAPGKLTSKGMFNLTKGKSSSLFVTIDLGLSGTSLDTTIARSFIASNRNTVFAPYIALAFDDSKHNIDDELPSMSYLDNDYRCMRDYTNFYYDRTVQLSKVVIEGTTKKKFKDLNASVNTVNNSQIRDGYPQQYGRKDFYLDYNYEDLSLVNLYKTDPENIDDIVNFYDISSEAYYEIGTAFPQDIIARDNSKQDKRDVVLGKGDCFLDRTYFKHTSWFSTELSMGNNDVAGGDPNWTTKKVGTNWEVIGGRANFHSYTGHFTSALTSYAHGVTVGVITENKFNIALKGRADSTVMNSYPYSMLMPNKTIAGVVGVPRKNRVLVYPHNDVSGAGGRTYPLYYNLSYNHGYHRTLSDFFYTMENDQSFLKYSYPNRIRWSYFADSKAVEDGWAIWDLGAYHDYISSHGKIVRINDIDGTLVSFLDNGMLQHSYSGDEVQVTEEQILSVGGNFILSRNAVLISEIGLSHKDALVKTDIGIYGIDTNKDALWAVRRSQQPTKYETTRAALSCDVISSTLGIQEWYNKYINNVKRTHGMSLNVSDVLSTFPDTSFRGFGVIAGYDRKYREVLFTFLNSYKSITICLSEMLGAYTSLYSFTPYLYFNIKNDMFSVIRKDNAGRRVYLHNNAKSFRQHFYNSFYGHDFMLTITVNGATEQRNTMMLSKMFESMDIESQQTPFSEIVFETKDQRAEHPFMDEDKWWSKPEYLSHHWQVPIQIDNISDEYEEDLYYKDSSMLGTWMRTTLIYNGDNRDKEIFINNIVTNFNISYA